MGDIRCAPVLLLRARYPPSRGPAREPGFATLKPKGADGRCAVLHPSTPTLGCRQCVRCMQLTCLPRCSFATGQCVAACSHYENGAVPPEWRECAHAPDSCAQRHPRMPVLHALDARPTARAHMSLLTGCCSAFGRSRRLSGLPDDDLPWASGEGSDTGQQSRGGKKGLRWMGQSTGDPRWHRRAARDNV